MRSPRLASGVSLSGISKPTGKAGGYDRVAERRKAMKAQVKQETLLETLLGKNREWQKEVKELLKNVPSGMAEFNILQDRLEKLLDSEAILLRQLGARK